MLQSPSPMWGEGFGVRVPGQRVSRRVSRIPLVGPRFEPGIIMDNGKSGDVAEGELRGDGVARSG